MTTTPKIWGTAERLTMHVRTHPTCCTCLIEPSAEIRGDPRRITWCVGVGLSLPHSQANYKHGPLEEVPLQVLKIMLDHVRPVRWLSISVASTYHRYARGSGACTSPQRLKSNLLGSAAEVCKWPVRVAPSCHMRPPSCQVVPRSRGLTGMTRYVGHLNVQGSFG